MDRWLGRQSTGFAVIFLTFLATLFGGLLSLSAYRILYGPPPNGLFLINPLISMLVSAPIIYYSQVIIRNLARTKRDLAALSERLSTAYELAEGANRSKSAFLANMSHELRTPLNVIIGFSEILIKNAERGVPTSKNTEYYHDIKSSGEALLGIINDILDLSRIEAGHTELLDDVIQLTELLNDIERMIAPLAGNQQLILSIKPQSPAPNLRGSERLVRQMLLNLLSNAVKFTQKGGHVSVVTELMPSGWLRLAVIDNGIGMSPDDLEEALLPFGQVDSSLSRNHQGTGLGLPLTKAMIERHGGTMTIDSAAGTGTEATLLFPPDKIILP